MLRRLVLCALALCAFAALEGCGVTRLTGPDAQSADHPRAGSTARKYSNGAAAISRDGDGDGSGSGGTYFGAVPSMAEDSLGFHHDDIN